MRALELLVGPCRTTARPGINAPAPYLELNRAGTASRALVKSSTVDGTPWHPLAFTSEPAHHAMVFVSIDWRRQEKLPAKSFGGQLFAVTDNPAMVCVGEKSCPPSNVHAWVFASPYLSKSQDSRPTRDPDWWKAGKWVTHFFSSVASFFQRCQLFPALPAFSA